MAGMSAQICTSKLNLNKLKNENSMKSKIFSLLIFLGLSVAFTSCEQSDVDLTTDEATLVEFISLATNATTNAIANTTDPTKTATTCVGKKSKLTQISVSELSGTITAYISAD